MLNHEPLIAKYRYTRDGVHVLRMQESDKLGKIRKRSVVLAEQRMFERNIHAAVAVFDVKYHGISANFAPVADDPYSMITAGHEARQINGANFEIASHR